MRVAFVSTVGPGHLNSIRFIWERTRDSHLFLVRFHDEVIPFENTERLTTLTVNQNKPYERASLFNAVRERELRDALHVWIYDYHPTLIVYDFFCLEAYHVSRVMGIPAICSIPATLKPDETNTCSDAVLLPEHFYWAWRERYPVAIEPVAFLGPARRRKPENAWTQVDLPPEARGSLMMVVTFGTVIPKYEGCREQFDKIMEEIAAFCRKERGYFVIFAGIQGPALFNCLSLPYEKCDLPALLRDLVVDVLVFHGGGNTYSEALAARVPRMLVCPFFGDQFETGRQCGNMYDGSFEQSMQNLKPHIYKQSERPTYDIPFSDRFPDYWRRGDLLFGHRRHRAALQKAFPQVNLHLEHYAPFGTFANPHAGEMPAIADVYNDQLGPQGPGILTGDESPFGQRLIHVAEKRKESEAHLSHLPEEHRLVHYCLQIMQLTIEAGNKIHFVLGPADELGPATKIELTHIQSKWPKLRDHIIFYNLGGVRIPAPLGLSRPKKASDSKPPTEFPVDDEISRALKSIPGRMPLVWGRLKSDESIEEKRFGRQLPVLDHVGWRTTYLNETDMIDLVLSVPRHWSVSVTWCKQHVRYYYYAGANDRVTELQVWPHIYLHCFYLNAIGLDTKLDTQFRVQEMIENERFF